MDKYDIFDYGLPENGQIWSAVYLIDIVYSG